MARRVRIARLVYVAIGVVTAVVFAAGVAGPGVPGSAAAPSKTTHCILGCSGSTTTVHLSTTVPTTVPKTTTSKSTVAASTTSPTTTRVFTTLPPSTTSSSTTTTTIAAIGGLLPKAPQTLPLRTHGTSAHVDPVLAMLSGIGFFLALVIVLGRFVVTSSRWRRSKA